MDHSHHHGYSDSANSDTSNDTSPSGPVPGSGGGKIRLMCSYGGHIVPRPHDKTLCYLGGDTRIVVLDRRSSLAELSTVISSTLVNSVNVFVLKYQLPGDDLDSLISVTTDEDLENMIEEYDRTVGGGGGGGGGGGPCRLRLFLFPVKTGSAASSSSVGSVLDDSKSKSENWFVDALNGAALPRPCSDANSVNCLLGLHDAAPAPTAAGAGKADSPLTETASSFSPGVEEQLAALMAGEGADDVSPAAAAAARVSPNDERRRKADSLDSAAAAPRDSFAPAIPRPNPAIDSDSIPPPFATRTAATVADQKQRAQVHDPSLLLQMQQTEQQTHQFIPAGAHHVHHPTAVVPLAPYYIHHPQQLDQHQYPQVYFVPAVRPNPATPSAAPQQACPTRTAAPAKAAGGGATATLQHQYVGYRQLGYEYVDPMQAAIYYAQPGGSPPAAASQYQTVTSAAAESKQQGRS